MRELIKKYDFLLVCALFALIGVYLSPELAGRILCASLFALSFQFLYARLGLLSFGHAAFWGSGAYICAILIRDTSLPVLVIVLIAMLANVGLGALFALFSVKSEGIYFSMITLALAQILYFVALKNPNTGGEDGIPLANIFVEKNINANFFGIILISFAFIFYLLKLCDRSRWRLILAGLKDNPLRAESLGFNSFQHKFLAFTAAAAVAGLAGALKTLHTGVASLSDLHWHLSGEVVLMVLLGGAFNPWGAVLGATLLSFLQNYFAESGSLITVFQGVLFVLCILFFRSGIIPQARARV